ncbi:MAG TPA: hypothetical protein VFT80_07595 [Actinomycetota bacterium]|nr:hypothetical protein [Actinomycetota bacterium]
MRYLLVVLVSLGAGAIAYVVTMRSGERELAVGFEPEAADEPGAAPPLHAGYTYLKVEVTRGPSIRERLQGFVGSLALVAVAIVATVGALWGLGVLIARLIESFVEDGGSQPLP